MNRLRIIFSFFIYLIFTLEFILQHVLIKISETVMKNNVLIKETFDSFDTFHIFVQQKWRKMNQFKKRHFYLNIYTYEKSSFWCNLSCLKLSNTYQFICLTFSNNFHFNLFFFWKLLSFNTSEAKCIFEKQICFQNTES